MPQDVTAARLQQPVIRLSAPQFRVLRNLSLGLPAEWSLRGRSQHGGHRAVLRALRVRGLIDSEGEITYAGRQAVSAG